MMYHLSLLFLFKILKKAMLIIRMERMAEATSLNLSHLYVPLGNKIESFDIFLQKLIRH